MLYLALFIFLTILCPSEAFAYIDPGTGNFVFTSLSSLLSIVGIFLGIFFRPLFRFFKWLFRKFQRNRG